MRSRRFRSACTSLAVLGLVGAFAGAAAAGPFRVLHSFSGLDGVSPNALVQVPGGLFFGSAAFGGDTTACAPDGCGTLFTIDRAGAFMPLHVFHATDGSGPTGLARGRDGNLYGTTSSGGQPSGGGAGTFFRITPAGAITVLHAFVGGFGCCDGAAPTAQPLLAADGNLYGTTSAGGAFRDVDHQSGFGTVYRVVPATGALSVLHSFQIPEGIFPNGPLVQASDGFLYGTTREGGPGAGTVFRLATDGTGFSVVHAFTVADRAAQPLAGVIQAADALLYGTTQGSGGGTVFRSSTTGVLELVNVFDGADGWRPTFGLLQASDGRFYGTTPQGGLLGEFHGALFRLDANGTLEVLHSFTGADGLLPNSRLVEGRDGRLYGTTAVGGSGNRGTIFRLDPRVAGPVASLTVQPAEVPATQDATGTVTLSSPAPATGRAVVMTAAQGQITLPAKVKVPAGATSASFTIHTLSSGATARVRIYASIGGRGVRTVLTVVAP